MLSVGLGVPKGALLSTERAQGWGDRRAKADATSFPGWPQVLRLQPPAGGTVLHSDADKDGTCCQQAAQSRPW